MKYDPNTFPKELQTKINAYLGHDPAPDFNEAFCLGFEEPENDLEEPENDRVAHSTRSSRARYVQIRHQLRCVRCTKSPKNCCCDPILPPNDDKKKTTSCRTKYYSPFSWRALQLQHEREQRRQWQIQEQKWIYDDDDL